MMLPTCRQRAECFARNASGKCLILSETDYKPCAFFKTPEEYREGLELYGSIEEYERRRLNESRRRSKKKGGESNE